MGRHDLLYYPLGAQRPPARDSFFKSEGRPDELYKTSIYSVVVNVLFCLVLIPSYGIIGAAVASSISYLIYGALMIRKFINFTKIPFLNLITFDRNDLQNLKKTISK